jgi:hypothetical protein
VGPRLLCFVFLEISQAIDFAVAFASKTKVGKAIQEIDKNQDAATCKPKVAELMS